MCSSGLLIVCFLAVVGSTTLTAAASVDQFHIDLDDQDALQLLNIMFKSRTPKDFREEVNESGVRRLVYFSWNDCGQGSDVAHLQSLTLSPDPLRLPGNVTFGFKWQTSSDLTSPISLDIKLEKKIAFIWITVPCGDIPGGCHHDDVCKELSPVTCPPEYQACHCPFKKGIYTLTSATVDASKVGHVPSGDYRVTVWLKQGGTEIGCVFVAFAVA